MEVGESTIPVQATKPSKSPPEISARLHKSPEEAIQAIKAQQTKPNLSESIRKFEVLKDEEPPIDEGSVRRIETWKTWPLRERIAYRINKLFGRK